MAQAKWAEMDKLRPRELARRIAACPVVYVPSGIYEWHDEQNPMGADTLKMVEICRRTAALTGGLVHMPSYVGSTGFSRPAGGLSYGSLTFSDELVRSYLGELFGQLERMGFELIVLLYGHTSQGNINIHEEASRDYMRRRDSQAKVLCLNDVEPAVKHRYKVADHAAKWETSFMMAAHPERVDMGAIPADHGAWHGLDPCDHASAAEGERMYELVATETAKLVEMARVAPRSSLAEFTFPETSACWRGCRNILDLAEDFWQGDERWEDPFCWFCRWRSPGIVGALTERQGRQWMQRRMAIWEEQAAAYTCRARVALEALRDETASAAQAAPR